MDPDYKLIGCTDYKAVYMCNICSYQFGDVNCIKANEDKIYVKIINGVVQK